MKTNRDSKTLFVKQVTDHAQTLGKLLEAKGQQRIDARFMEKCIVSTKMLANSASLLSFNRWEDFLKAYESLLMKYRNYQHPWDERIAQVTSEIIEKEESLSATYKGEGGWDGRSFVSADEIQAMLEEVNVLLEMEGFGEDGEAFVEIPGEKGAPEISHSSFLGAVVPQLEESCGRLLGEWKLLHKNSGAASKAGIMNLRKEAYLVSFYTSSLKQITDLRDAARLEPVMSTVMPVKYVMEDFAEALSQVEERTVDIGFLGEHHQMDAGLLAKASRILQCMITDICQRCSEKYLRVEIEVEEHNESLLWKLRDNGDNFITDSRLDGDDFLAFYPGLREVRRHLQDCHGVLWVEPNEDHDTRFAFAMPILANKNYFRVWGKGKESYAVISTQICRFLTKEEAKIENDSKGETILLDGKWTPLVKLSLLFPDAPEQGDKIIEIGSLEKRIAFYVQGEGCLEDGVWLKKSVPVWKDLSWGMASLEGKKVPVIEAETLVQSYMSVLGGAYEGDFSGGVVENESNLSQSQVHFEKEVGPPPEQKSAESRVKVLIMERSEVLREAFSAIFSSCDIEARMFDSLEDVVDYLKENNPRVIISEFRTPSMAAKVLMEHMKKEGIKIPVFVTTAQDEKKAFLIVKGLGAAGYLTKPLNPEEVIGKLRAHLPAAKDYAAGD